MAMSNPIRRERWRVTHARLIASRRTGGDDAMTTRLRVPVFRGGQGRPVEVLPTDTYSPMSWDATQQRVKDLLAYRPKSKRENWSTHAEIVRDLVLRTDYFDRLRDRHLAGTLHRFFGWAAANGFSTDPASLLSGDRIEKFVRENYAPGSHTTHAWRLRHVAATVFPPPPEVAKPRRTPLDPHSLQDKERFIRGCESLVAGHFASSKRRQSLHRDVQIILALTFGAGCNGKCVHRVKEGWIRRGPDGVWLDRPDRSVSTPIAEPWGHLILAALTGDASRWLVRPNAQGPRNEQVGKVFFDARKESPALVGFDCDRAARRWHADVLEQAHFPDLAALLGYKPGSHAPVDLIPHIDPTPHEAQVQRVRGWVR